MGYPLQHPRLRQIQIRLAFGLVAMSLCLGLGGARPALAADPPTADATYAFSDRYPVEIPVLGEMEAREVAAMKIDVDAVRLPNGPAMPGVVVAYINDRDRADLEVAGYFARPIPNESKQAHAEVYRHWEENGLLNSRQIPDKGERYDNWYSFTQLEAELQQFAVDYPNLISIQSIGTSVQGRNLWMLKISDNVTVEEAEPEFRYTSTIHGDEVTGCEMLRRMLHHFMDNYGTDPAITNLIDSAEIYFMPMHNPDGFVAGTRYNAHGQDLNRNFPDPVDDPYDDPSGREPEVQAMMYFGYGTNSVLGGNMHGGALVMNIPWDCRYDYSPDHDLFWHISEEYSYLNPPMWNSSQFYHGVTHGAEWYLVHGGMQDWSYEWRKELHITMELSNTKWPSWSTMDTFWNQNRDAMLKMMSQVLEGVHGIVTDADTGDPVLSTVTVAETGREIRTDEDFGDYCRLLLPGTYTFTFEALGYVPQTIGGVVVVDDVKTTLDVALQPLPHYELYGTVTEDGTGQPLSAMVEVRDHTTGDLVDSRSTDPGTGTYSFASLPGASTYDVKAVAALHVPDTQTITLTSDTQLNFQLEESSNMVLVVTDGDVTQIAVDLQAMGYDVNQEAATATDPGTWAGYGVLIWSAGNNQSPLSSSTLRNALETHVASAGRLLIEGGEVGYDAVRTPGYPSLAANVLHINDWDTDNAGALQLAASGHALATSPNVLPASYSIDYSGYGDQDAVRPTGDATKVYRTTSYSTDAGVIVYDDDANAEDGQIVYFAFNYDALSNHGAAQDLLENAMHYLTGGDTTDVDDPAAALALSRPMPNPLYNGEVRMVLALPQTEMVRATVFDVAGRQVQSLQDGALEPGSHEIDWDGRGFDGRSVGAGVYWVRVAAGDQVMTRQVSVVR